MINFRPIDRDIDFLKGNRSADRRWPKNRRFTGEIRQAARPLPV
jgi:hypothetical protein